MMASRTSPAGWRWVRFGDVVRQVKATTKDPESEGLSRIVGLEHLDSESLPLRRWHELDDLPDGTSFTRIFQPGQVLFGKRRAYQRKVAVADFAGICSGDILVFEPSSDEILAEFLPYVVQSDGFFDHALGTSAGSLSPRTKWQELAKYEFALPPVGEQLQATAALETIGEQVNALNAVMAAASQLRAALIASAASSPQAKLLPVGELASQNSQGVQVGPFGGSLSSRYFSVEGVPVLKINNITEDGQIDLREVVRTPPEHAETLSRYLVQEGDVVTAAQATIGRTALIPATAAGALISQHLIRVRVDPSALRPELLAEFFNDPLVLRQMASVKTKTTRDGLNTSDVEAFEVPVLPIVVQDRLVDDLRSARCLGQVAASHRADVVRLGQALVSDLLGRGNDV